MTSPIRIGSGSIILVPDARQFLRRAKDDLKAIELSKNVILTPQLPREFRKTAQTKVDAVHITGNVHLSPRLSDTFRADAKEKVQAAIAGISTSITIKPNVDTARATAHMENWRARQQRPLRIRVVTVHEGGGSGHSGHGGGGAADLLPGMGGAVDATEVARALQKLNREMDRQGGVKLKATPQLNNRAGQQLQRDMDRMANSLRLDPRVGGLNLRVPLGGAFGLTMLPEMISQLGGLTAAIQEVAQAGLILPGVFAAAGASFATVLVGISGLKDAYKALDTVQKDSVTTGANTRAAQREMRDAVQDETHARRQLSDAIQNEQRRQRDLTLQLRGGKLAEAGAILEIQEAAEKLRTGRFANRMEYDQGLLDYEDKIQNLLEVRNRNADLQADVAKNEKSGVANSDSVLSATEALTKATERIADASQKMADGSGALATASAKAQEALDKLSPSAQSFIKNLIAMRPEFHAFAQGIQEDLMSGLTPAFNNLFHSPAIQTNLKGGMQGLAKAMNAQLQTVMSSLGSPQMGTIYDRIFGSTSDATKRFNGSGLTQMINGFAKLGAVGAEELPRLSDALGTIMTRFDNFVSKADKDGSLKHWMDQGLDAFTSIGHIVQNIFTAMQGVNRVFGNSFLTEIDTVTKRVADFLNSGRGQSDLERLVSETKQAMADWKPILMDLIPILRSVFDTAKTYVSGMLGPLDIVLKVLGNIPGGVETVVTAFAAFKSINAIVTPITGILGGLEGALGRTYQRLGGMEGGLGKVGGAALELKNKVGLLSTAVGVGGPLAMALTFATTIALDQFIKKQQEAEEETRQLTQRQNEFAESLDRTTGLITQQSRDMAAKGLSDYAPTHKGSLTGNALQEAQKLGVGGPQGADLVTAALPGGESQYKNIMGQLRDKVRPMVTSDPHLMEIFKSHGLSEDDAIDALLGVPSAKDKYDKALQNAGPEPIQTRLPGLDTLQQTAQAKGGDVLGAAIVGQALSGQRAAGTGGAAGSPAQLARQAANPNVGLPPNSVFGPDAQAFGGNGQFKITTSLTPQDGNISKIVKAGATPEAPIPPSTLWTYTLPHELAQKYMTGVPQYHGGGPTKAGLGNLLDDEFVIKDRDRFPAGALDALNDGKINPDDLPHFAPGGPVIAGPKLDEPAPMPDPIGGVGAGPGDSPSAGFIPPPAPPPAPTTLTPPAPTDLSGGLGDAVPGAKGESPMGGGLDISGALGQGVPSMPTLPGNAGVAPPADLAGAPIPTIPGAGLNSLFFGAQGAPTGPSGPGVAPGGGGMFNGQNFLQSFLGGGGGGDDKSIGGMLEQIAGKFGSILMSGVLGFFGINPQYMQDVFKLIPGLAKLGGGYQSKDAQSAVESQILSYDPTSGAPIYYTPGSPGTPLPDAAGTGTGGGGPGPPSTTNPVTGGSGTAPSGAVISANPASKAGAISGAPNVGTNLANAPAGMFTPLYKPGTNSGGYGNSGGLPDWAVQLGAQFGLSPSTYNGEGTHGEGYAMDFSPISGNKDPMGSMNRFSEFIKQNLGSQTLQLIHWDPGNGQTSNTGYTGSGQHWGMAAARHVDTPGGAFQDYYTKGGEGYGGHVDHVHWATDVPVVMGDPNGIATNPLINTAGSGSSSSAQSQGVSATPPATSPGPQVTNPSSAGTSTGGGSGGGTTPLPPDIQAQINGQLPPSQISPVPAGSQGTGDESDADQVIAMDSKGQMTIESRGVAKARGDVILGMAPKDGAGVGDAGSFRPPANMVIPSKANDSAGGAGLDINLPTAGGGGRGLTFPKLWSPGAGGVGQLKSDLDATGSTNADSMDLKSRAKAMYLKAGLPANEWSSFDQLISHESGWRPTAQNPGSTAHGLGQFLDTTWATVGAAKTDDADTQLRAVFKYLQQRPDYHGSPAAAWNLWQQRHWYDKGGVVDDLKGLGGVAGSFLDDAGVMALNALAHAKGGSSKMLSGAAKMLGPFGMIAPELLDAISPQAHTSDSDTLDYTKALKGLPHAARGRYITEGSGHKDDVLAMVKRGEFVHTDKSVDTYGLDFHTALNAGMIDPKLVAQLMGGGGIPHFAAGGTLGNQASANDLQAIQNQLAGQMVTPTPPVPPSRSGVDMSQIPDIAKKIPPAADMAPPSSPSIPMPLPPPQPGMPTAPPAPAPLEPEAGVPVQADIAPAPKSTEHELPAIKQAVNSTASTLGTWAAMAAQMAGAAGSMGAGGQIGGAAAGSLIQGAFMQGAKIVNGLVNVASSAMVGTLTPGTTANPYGERVKGNAAPSTLMPMTDNSTHYHGDLYANDMDDFMRRQDIRDSVNYQSQMAAAPGM